MIFWGLPGVAEDEPYVLPFDAEDGTWWRARPLRLELAGGEGPPQWDPAARVLTVLLPQAATARVRMVSRLSSPELMGMLRWCEHELGGDDLDRVVEAVKANRCWLTTPWHELELVHAVQHPLQVPGWAALTASRSLGRTYTDVAGTASLDGRSTERVDLVAAWTEPVDDPSEPGPRELAGRTTVFSLPMDASAVVPDDRPAGYRLRDGKELSFDSQLARERGAGLPGPHQLGDTRYRRISYALTATTRFREDFPAPWIDQPRAAGGDQRPPHRRRPQLGAAAAAGAAVRRADDGVERGRAGRRPGQPAARRRAAGVDGSRLVVLRCRRAARGRHRQRRHLAARRGLPVRVADRPGPGPHQRSAAQPAGREPAR